MLPESHGIDLMVCDSPILSSSYLGTLISKVFLGNCSGKSCEGCTFETCRHQEAKGSKGSSAPRRASACSYPAVSASEMTTAVTRIVQVIRHDRPALSARRQSSRSGPKKAWLRKSRSSKLRIVEGTDQGERK